jgi:hypothetical protein
MTRKEPQGRRTGGWSRRRNRFLCPLFLALAALLLPVLAKAQPAIRISFSRDETGKPPSGWISRNGGPEQVYSVQVEGPDKYLHADARGIGVQLGHEQRFSLKEFPVMEWRWRAVLFPSHSDERKKSGDDSVLGLYVLFGRLPFFSAIKYIWSDTLPVGTTLDSPFSSRTKLVVVESGRALAGAWVEEKHDVLADYRRLFGNQEPPEVTGIAILTDGDNTNSHAIGDYGEISILRDPGGVSP